MCYVYGISCFVYVGLLYVLLCLRRPRRGTRHADVVASANSRAKPALGGIPYTESLDDDHDDIDVNNDEHILAIQTLRSRQRLMPELDPDSARADAATCSEADFVSKHHRSQDRNIVIPTQVG